MPPRARTRLDGDRLYEAALRWLARRDRTQVEMRRWLIPRALDAAAADSVMERLREYGYLNDVRLAEAYAARQKDVERHGPRRALRDLRARGIDAGLAAGATARGYGGANETVLLRAYIRKKRLTRPETLRQAGQHYRRWLLAGFAPATCQQALRAWKIDPEWLDAIEATEWPDDDQAAGC